MARVPAALVGRSFGVILAVFAAFVAAALAHVAIDVAGDYLLSNDTYDHVAHHSRAIVAVAGGACGLLMLLLAAWNAFDEQSPQSSVSRAAFPRVPALGWFVPAVMVLTLGLLLGMEVDDAWAASGTLIDIDDALGGSLWLGGITVAISGFACGALGWLFARWITGVSAALVSAITGLFVARSRSAQTSSAHRRRAAAITFRSISPLADRSAKRGPPITIG